MEYSFESHTQKLHDLCRLCGSRALTVAERRRSKKKNLCADFSEDILMVYNIFIQRDKESVHPKFFCHKCRAAMDNFKKRGQFGTLNSSQMRAGQTETLWTEYDANVGEDECAVCSQYAITRLGNYQTKLNSKNSKPSPQSTSTNSASMTTDNQDSHITETSEELTDNTTFGIDELVIATTPTDNEAETSILENNLSISHTPLKTKDMHTSTPTNKRNCVLVSQSTTQTTP